MTKRAETLIAGIMGIAGLALMGFVVHDIGVTTSELARGRSTITSVSEPSEANAEHEPDMAPANSVMPEPAPLAEPEQPAKQIRKSRPGRESTGRDRRRPNKALDFDNCGDDPLCD